MNSLNVSVFFTNANLTISCDGNSTDEVIDFCKSIDWKHGGFEVIEHKESLGVDQHNIECMKMALKNEHIIVLEDDLTVSPYFLHFIEQARKLQDSSKIAGIALYRYSFNEANRLPFNLIDNNEFAYYQQRSCSKGTFYTKQMVEDYLAFLDGFTAKYSDLHLPKNVKRWNDEVFEKSIYAYLQETGKYTLFPRFSFTTDHADLGVHMTKQTNKYAHQTSMYLSDDIGKIPELTVARNVYDCFYEMMPSALKLLNPQLVKYDFQVDIYGYKNLDFIQSEYLLSSKACADPKIAWARKLKPEIANIISNQEGDFYSLGKKETFENSDRIKKLKEDFLYYYPDTKITDLIRMKLAEIASRFTRK